MSAMGLISVLLVADRPSTVRGAVMVASPDPVKQMPIAGVAITVTGAPGTPAIRSDASGAFSIPLSWHMRVGQRVTLHFWHPDYLPLDLRYVGGNELYLARLTPLVTAQGPEVPIGNVMAKYSVNTTTSVNIGSAVRTFEVVNQGNRPCKAQKPCSPDGKWKAAIGSVLLDAGPGNEFHNARASCIAGPCPFTRIEDNVNRSRPARTLRVSVLNWSDTATFLVEAEVYRSMVRDVLRQSYPIIFDRALTFTLPPGADDLSIEAEVNGSLIVFPLGPTLWLSWADCQLVVNPDQSKVCRCELKPGFRFAGSVVRNEEEE
jgi:hypothetical protein